MVAVYQWCRVGHPIYELNRPITPSSIVGDPILRMVERFSRPVEVVDGGGGAEVVESVEVDDALSALGVLGDAAKRVF